MAMGIVAAALVGGLALAPQAAEAQFGRDRRDRDWNFARQYRGEVRRLVERLERDSNSFRSEFEKHRWNDRDRYRDSRYRGYRDRDDRYYRDRDDRYYRDNRDYRNRWEDMKRDVQLLDERIEDLRREIGRNEYWVDTRVQMSDVMRLARTVDRFMDDRDFDVRGNRTVEDRWRRVIGDINALAALFGLGRV
jgi:hypothetical protein